jgi:hypothetical protein
MLIFNIKTDKDNITTPLLKLPITRVVIKIVIKRYKVHSRWIFSAKLLSRCKPAPPFLVNFTLSCFIRDRAIESDLTSLILNVSLTCEIKSQIF